MGADTVIASAIGKELSSTRRVGSTTVVGVAAALLLISAEVIRHSASMQGMGKGLLTTDVSLLLTYGIAALWVSRQKSAKVAVALGAATAIGLAVGAVHVANHVIEIFVPNRPFVVVIVPVLLMLALLGAAGSIAWERTQSFALAVISGLWCAMVATVVLICLVFSFNLAFENRAELQLRDAFVTSGLNDPGAFLVRNSLDAVAEFLIRMPIFGMFLSLAGAIVNAWITGRTRKTAFALACVTPVMLAIGVAALWYADTLERATRPPFVLFGVLLAGFALCSVHPAWSALRRAQRYGKRCSPVELP